MSAGVYLLHFDRPYRHARHYIGCSDDIERRLDHHRRGRGANLLRIVVAAGIRFDISRIWPGEGRTFERQLKRRGGATRHCPACIAERGAA